MSTIALSHLPVPSGWRNADAFYGPALERIRTAVRDPRATERVARYYSRDSNYPGATFNSLGDPDPGRITERDLLAVAMMDTRTEPSMVRALLEGGSAHDTVRELLDPQRLPVDARLQEADADLVLAMDQLYTTLRALVPPPVDRYQQNWAPAAKLCARKRPNLFPLRAEGTIRYLGMWPSRYQVDWQVFHHVLSDAQLRDDVARIVERAAEAPGVDVGDPGHLLRHLEVIVWMHAPAAHN
ncbi:DUF6308 family protein [Piscicoccus intestinalis]|uniref:DUF6308 family protein n=1 Tax=Piscicoccus intestinalis TaxID=746033 RepID=UPI000838BE22|nr:DUF6308 family protein [Piscicoccus intestinalis]